MKENKEKKKKELEKVIEKKKINDNVIIVLLSIIFFSFPIFLTKKLDSNSIILFSPKYSLSNFSCAIRIAISPIFPCFGVPIINTLFLYNLQDI